MKFPRLFLICSLPALMAGCAGVTEQQAAIPAIEPVIKAPVPDHKVYKKPEPKPVEPVIRQKASPPPPAEVVTIPLEPEAPPEWATSVEPSQPARLSPVVVALISDADQNSRSGNLDSAVASLERGLRIEPRNATLIYKLAEVRLKQSKPRLAEDLAKKSALLAGSDRILKRQSWLLIAEARKLQGNFAGAKEAEFKAGQF